VKRIAKGIAVLAGLAFGLAILVLFGFRHVALQRETLAAEALAPETGRFVPTPSGRIFVQEFGPRDGEPVLMVHGTAAWSGFWRRTAESLARSGHRAIAVDLPPFGLSDHDPEADYSRAAQARRLVQLLDALGAPKATIIGHSFGSGAVAELMLTRPDRLSRVIFVAAALGLSETGEPETPSRLMEGLLAPRLVRELVTSATMTNMFATRWFLAGMLARKEAADAEQAEILRTPLRRVGTTSAYADWLPRLLLPDLQAASARAERYRAVRLPVALVWGDADTLTPIAQARHLARLMPHATLDILPGIGHIPHIEAPERTLEIIRVRLANQQP
jgi:pimeloyl-ACP methyl ester carboxylesterase